MYSLSLTSISFVMEVCYLEHIVFCLNFLFLCQSMQATLQALITEYLRSLLTKILSYSLWLCCVLCYWSWTLGQRHWGFFFLKCSSTFVPPESLPTPPTCLKVHNTHWFLCQTVLFSPHKPRSVLGIHKRLWTACVRFWPAVYCLWQLCVVLMLLQWQTRTFVMIYAVLSLRECKRVGALSSTLSDTCCQWILKGTVSLVYVCVCVYLFVAFRYKRVLLKDS